MGVLSHVLQQWQYRMRSMGATKITTEEIYVLFTEFSECLSAVSPAPYEEKEDSDLFYELN